MEIGVFSFVELMPDPVTGERISPEQRFRELMEQVENPVTDVTLVLNDAPGHREIAVAVQSMWSELGIDTEIQQQEWAQFLESIGPPPGRQIDAFRLGWIADFVDAMNFLELWTCESGNNSTNFCDPEYDRLVEQARNTPDDAERWDLYGQMEEIMFGPDGAVPTIPIYWYTYVTLESESIQDTFNLNPLDQIDLTLVTEGDQGDEEVSG